MRNKSFNISTVSGNVHWKLLGSYFNISSNSVSGFMIYKRITWRQDTLNFDFPNMKAVVRVLQPRLISFFLHPKHWWRSSWMTSIVRVEKDLPLHPSSLLIHVSSLLWLPPSSSTQTHSYSQVSISCHLHRFSTVSVSQPLPSTLHALSCSSAPPRSSQPSTLLHHLHPLHHHHHQHPTALREPCQSQAYKRGLDGSLGGQPAPLCSPAQRRMKLACGGRSVAVGHSRQPGSGACAGALPSTPLPQLPPPPRPSTSPGSLPIIPRNPPTHLTSILPLLPRDLKPFNPPHGAEKQGRRGWRLDASRWVKETCCLNQSLFGIPGRPLLSRSRTGARCLWALHTLGARGYCFHCLFWNVGILLFPFRFMSFRSVIKLVSSCLIWIYAKTSKVCIHFSENAVMWQHRNWKRSCNICNTKLPSPAYDYYCSWSPKIAAPSNLIQSPKTQARSITSIRARSPQS